MADILRAVSSLLWPVIVGVLLLALLPVARRLISNSQSVDIEVAGTKISIQRASDDIRKLIEDLQDQINRLSAVTPNVPAETFTDTRAMQPRSPLLVWVDDQPDANVFERARATEAGYRLVQAASTKEAVQVLASNGPAAVIVSDMKRVEDGNVVPTAGLGLLRSLRLAGDQTRVVFYSSSRSLSPVIDELRHIPNTDYTTSPTELARLLDV